MTQAVVIRRKKRPRKRKERYIPGYPYHQAKQAREHLSSMAIIESLNRAKVNPLRLEPYPAPVVGKACPKCGGFVYLDKVPDGYQPNCLNCGLRGGLDSYKDSDAKTATQY